MKNLCYLLSCLLCFTSQQLFAQTWQEVYHKADSLMQKRLFKESIPLYEQALTLAEKEYGKNSENYLLTRNGLGTSMISVKKKEETESFLLENILLCKSYGEKTEVHATALLNAGIYYLPSRKGNNPKKSEENLQMALSYTNKFWAKNTLSMQVL